MTGILGYARVSTSDQDVAGQSMRLTEAGAIKVITDVRSGRIMDRPGLVELLAYARNGDTLAASNCRGDSLKSDIRRNGHLSTFFAPVRNPLRLIRALHEPV